MDNKNTQTINSSTNQPPPLKGGGAVELRSEKVRNVIGTVPPGLLRHGVGIIALSLLALVGAAAFIPYTPEVNTEITVTQDSTGELHYSAAISQEAMKKQSQFAYIGVNPASEIPMPSRFRIVFIQETAHISTDKVWYEAAISPLDSSSQNIKLQGALNLPAKIILRKKSVLGYALGK